PQRLVHVAKLFPHQCPPPRRREFARSLPTGRPLMARPLLARQLNAGRLAFALADQTDEADLRRLLRQTPMSGRIQISIEREPDYFAEEKGLTDSPRHRCRNIVAREAGRLLCAGSCAVGPRYLNGEPRPVGYLGGLRLDAAAAGRFDILRRGYEFFGS